ncbi:MAG TPA: DUF6165 family protein [Polyangiaceae bacterium]|nr:DUF6165 family protein [Polyangiaceae bacterium]
MGIRIEVSAGELIDRICILEIKARRLALPVRSCVERQLLEAEAVRDRSLARSAALSALTERLRAANLTLWEAEEALRECEHRQSFGSGFVELARAVYRTNDERAALKQRIDELCNSEVREHKSFALPET